MQAVKLVFDKTLKKVHRLSVVTNTRQVSA